MILRMTHLHSIHRVTRGHLLFSITNTLYIVIAVKFLEGKDLRKVFGKECEAYQKNVPMVIPF